MSALATHRERGLRLVEDVEALGTEAVHDERDEGLAVGLLVQRPAAVRGDGIGDLLDVRRDREEALRPQEVAGPGTGRAAYQAEVPVQRGVRGTGRDGHVLTAALSVETGGDSDRLGQRRLAAAVLAGQQRHRGVEWKLVQLAHRRDRERVVVEVVDLVSLQDDRPDERAAHSGSLWMGTTCWVGDPAIGACFVTGDPRLERSQT